MARVEGIEYPEDRFYDLGNQIWYAPLDDGRLRAGFTPISMALAGDVLAFTPKRTGRPFEKGRYFATIECGKWVGSARAAFGGVVAGHNEALVRAPGLLNTDAFGEGWMLLVRPSRGDWRRQLITGADIGPAFEEWLRHETYKTRDG